jgi:DNA-binding transcriptional ArsR family regulator
MAFEVDPGLLALFGSGTRVRVLAPLANASAPLTAYRIASLVGVPRTKVYAELDRLASAGIVKRFRASESRTVWELCDPDLRRLLRRKARIVWSRDLIATAVQRAARTRRILLDSRRKPLDPRYFTKPFRPRNVREFARSREKDALLASLGLRISRRAGMTR